MEKNNNVSYHTEVFELMKQCHVTSVFDLLKHISYRQLSAECKRDLSFLSNFYSGSMTVQSVENGCYEVTSLDSNLRFQLVTVDNNRACKVVLFDLETGDAEITYTCHLEEYAEFQSITAGEHCVAIWPKEFVM